MRRPSRPQLLVPASRLPGFPAPRSLHRGNWLSSHIATSPLPCIWPGPWPPGWCTKRRHRSCHANPLAVRHPRSGARTLMTIDGEPGGRRPHWTTLTRPSTTPANWAASRSTASCMAVPVAQSGLLGERGGQRARRKPPPATSRPVIGAVHRCNAQSRAHRLRRRGRLSPHLYGLPVDRARTDRIGSAEPVGHCNGPGGVRRGSGRPLGPEPTPDPPDSSRLAGITDDDDGLAADLPAFTNEAQASRTSSWPA